MRDDVTRSGYEVTDVKPRGIIIFLIGLAVLTVIVVVLLRAVFSMLEGRAVRHDRVEPLPVEGEAALRGDRHPVEPPPSPLLQANPADALAAMRAEESRILGTYGWVTREAGVARIPIDRAMELVLERGLPARDGMGGGASAASGAHGASGASHAGAGNVGDSNATSVAGDVIPRDSNSGRGPVTR